jgi:hypothetical protein
VGTGQNPRTSRVGGGDTPFEANQDNAFVQFVEGMANWLAGWSQDIFTMENEHVRFALNYGLPCPCSPLHRERHRREDATALDESTQAGSRASSWA